MSEVTVRLRPTTEPEFRALLDRLVPDYAADHVRSGDWPVADSVERASAEARALLPNGLTTPDHRFRKILDAASGREVGDLWWVRTGANGEQLFVYWIGVHDAERRHGFGAAALAELEREAVREGGRRISLHVFADNRAARAFYERIGFSPSHLTLAKQIPTQSSHGPG